MAMNYLWGDMYPNASVLNTAQQTIPEAADKAVLPADNGTDAAAAGGIKDAGNSNASTKEIFLFMLALLVVAFLMGCM